jgi:hypothetical protein
MITDKDCLAKYGKPDESFEYKWMTLYKVPDQLQLGAIPRRIYMNKDMVIPFTNFLELVRAKGIGGEIKTWDGCFNVRKQRGSFFAASLHSWGVAFDINAAWNGLGQVPTLSDTMVSCIIEAGFDWGGHWRRLDGMHSQLSRI